VAESSNLARALSTGSDSFENRSSTLPLRRAHEKN
jgi:hypothetical protein